jgi:hypothetical protein
LQKQGGNKIEWDPSALNVTEENIWTEGDEVTKVEETA